MKIGELLNVAEISEDIQLECHKTVEYIKSKGGDNFNYQDATNVFLFRKLAELQSQISYLMSQNQTINNHETD